MQQLVINSIFIRQSFDPVDNLSFIK